MIKQSIIILTLLVISISSYADSYARCTNEQGMAISLYCCKGAGKDTGYAARWFPPTYPYKDTCHDYAKQPMHLDLQSSNECGAPALPSPAICK